MKKVLLLIALSVCAQPVVCKTENTKLVPLEIELPQRWCSGHESHFMRIPNIEEYRDEPRSDIYVPVGVKNVALNKKVYSSDERPILGAVEQVTDGDKQAQDGSCLELMPYLQHVTIDLGNEYEIYAVLLWHYHRSMRVYLDVIVQISTDPDFTDFTTVFNNDHDNSAGFGIGKDKHYIDDYRGKLIDAKGIVGRYVRLYSNGNYSNDLNHYIEVEVYGRLPGVEYVPLEIEVPKKKYAIDMRAVQKVPNLEEFPKKPRPAFYAPVGTGNVAKNKKVVSSCPIPLIGDLAQITDGDKEGMDGSCMELDPGIQHITIDLETEHEIYAVVIWHVLTRPGIYYDVICQISADPDFKVVHTIFNNDIDNSVGMGTGKDKHFYETYEGKLIDAGGKKGRYVRFYSNGNSENVLNHYCEIEVYGLPLEKQVSKSSVVKYRPLPIVLPRQQFQGTGENLKGIPNLEPYVDRPRPTFPVPPDIKNVALGKEVSSSDDMPIMGELEQITDGDKEAPGGSYVELGPFLQHVTIDLGALHEIYAIVVWHYHHTARVYFDVVVQIGKDRDFIENITVYNNDIDNTSGLGIGKDKHYVEDFRGRLIDAKGNIGRYVRLYSNGYNSGDLNHYIEVEVYGRLLR